jgi:CelD/BcsL family acetyltransferase involved in cellulose biosynthesis
MTPSGVAAPDRVQPARQSECSGGLRVELITTLEALWALRADWLTLEAASGTNVPFQTWEWCTSWWKHLRGDHAGVRDLLRVCVIRNELDELVGIAPMMLTERPTVGPIRVRFLQFLGADPNITEIRSMLCVPEFEQACHAAVQDYLADNARDWRWIEWDGLRTDIAALDGVTVPAPADHDRTGFVVVLPRSWDEFMRGLHRSIRGSLRRYYRDLDAAGLSHRLEVVEAPTSIAAALNDFFRLYEARENLKGERSQADLFSSYQAKAFLTDVCVRLAERNVTKIFRFWIDDALVATRIGFEVGDNLYLYYSGWDSAYSKYSVMTLLVGQAFQYGVERGLRTVHLSTGRDLSKTRWGPVEIRYASGVQVPPRRSAHVVHFVYKAAKRLATSGVASALTPALLVRRSGEEAPQPTPLSTGGLAGRLSKFHGLAAAALAFELLDLLEIVVDYLERIAPPNVL